MGMSTHVTGTASSDYDKHLKIFNFCKNEGVSLPKETAAFFGSEDRVNPNTWEDYEIEEFLEVSLGDALTKYQEDMIEGFEIDIDKLPKNVKRIRFFNSW